MKNRIRILRQRNGMTLRELAAAVGTTPQSISRLETGNMTLSTDWLDRIAIILKVHPRDLLEGPGTRNIELLGIAGDTGFVRPARESSIAVDVPATDPVAIRLESPCGPYAAGEVLIGNRLQTDFRKAFGRDCIVMIQDDDVCLRRVLPPTPVNGQIHHLNGGQDTIEIGNQHHVSLAPIQGGRSRDDAIYFDTQILWAAPLIMRLSYL